MTQPTV